VSELGLGTWGLSGGGYGPVSTDEAERVILRALSLNIDLFETADTYGRGAMERMLGKLVPAETATIVTKIGTDLDAAPPQKRFELRYVREAFDRSRDRLGRERLDVVLLHNPSMLALGKSETFDFLDELRRLKALRGWGVSAGSPEVAQAAIHRGADVVELVYNVLAAEDLQQVTDDVVSHDVGLLARSVLSHGLLAGRWEKGRMFPEGDHRAERWTTDELTRRLAQVEAMRPLVTEPEAAEKPAEATSGEAAEKPAPAASSADEAKAFTATEATEKAPTLASPVAPANGEAKGGASAAEARAKAAVIPSLRALALRFVLANDAVSCAILGPRSALQLDELVRDASAPPPFLRDTALAELATRLRSVGVKL
jgi:aryl-alcohol dehydrogenase-like predicted oxidoreductase